MHNYTSRAASFHPHKNGLTKIAEFIFGPEFVQIHGEWNLCTTLKYETVLIKNSWHLAGKDLIVALY